LVGSTPNEPGSRAVIRKKELEVALEDEGALLFAEQLAAQVHDAVHCIAGKNEGLAIVLRHDRRSAGRACVISRIRKAREPLQEDFELEEHVDASRPADSREPLFARVGLLTPKSARIAQ
jgi:hypothetical protein